ncbi:ribbon-helix-helix protein, CopG family [Synechococcus sp. BDU 130192]|uniref:ribbon-helix-helix protein, CopG family n=1 Tax=Synechococcus sp. BDU 130192 TaxID=2042059 RepID=UPI000C077E9B|nr:ribbon-helix-helix protein, CopG family [Synechococcus sp. BDU 130192]
MSKQRKALDQILETFEEETPKTEQSTAVDTNPLAAQLAKPAKKKGKIRFTLDLEKPLDDRLTKNAKKLNRTKADLVRIAVERLLEELEQ